MRYLAHAGRLRDKLAALEYELRVVERSGSGRGMAYRLSRRAEAVMNAGTAYDLTMRLDKKAITVRILTRLKDRSLTNQEVRAATLRPG